MPTFLVRLTGLEPARRETLDPKSSASTNSATGAQLWVSECKSTTKNADYQIIRLKVSVPSR